MFIHLFKMLLLKMSVMNHLHCSTSATSALSEGLKMCSSVAYCIDCKAPWHKFVNVILCYINIIILTWCLWRQASTKVLCHVLQVTWDESLIKQIINCESSIPLKTRRRVCLRVGAGINGWVSSYSAFGYVACLFSQFD